MFNLSYGTTRLERDLTAAGLVCNERIDRHIFGNVRSLPGGAVVDPGPGWVGWSPPDVVVVPLPDMFTYIIMNIMRLL